MVEYKVADRLGYVAMESIRMEANGLESSSMYYVDKLISGEILPVGAYVDKNLIGGAYVSPSLSSLYIDSIFVKKEYQNRGYAKGLLQYIFDNKQLFEEYFNTEFDFSRLEPGSNDMVEFYKNIGYSGPNEMNIMKRRI